MNIMNKLTLRQMQRNKKRTFITIIGVIISAAMITAVLTLGLSFLDLIQRQTISNEGEWHVAYPQINKEQLENIKKDKETQTMILSKDIGYALLEKSQNKNKPYVFVRAYNKAGFENFPITLKEGRLPENIDEVVISEPVLTNAQVEYPIGEKVTFNIGKRYSTRQEDLGQLLEQQMALQKGEEGLQEKLEGENLKTYTIVGIINRPTWEPTWSPGYTLLTYIDENTLYAEEPINGYVILKNINKALFQHGKELAAQNGIKKVNYNNSLLRFYGVIEDDELRGTLFTLSAIIMSIIVIGSVSLIYNAFAISVAERSRHLGMLSSIGATKKQKRNSVFFEGAIIGAVSIPIGILAGLAGIGITFLCINPIVQGALGITESFRVVVSPLSLVAAVLIAGMTILISAYWPAQRASRLSAIDAIRQTTDLKLTGKAVKTSKLTRKVFGIEGDLGLKNLKRNRARYQATVFSLIISMLLFLVVDYFTATLKRAYTMTQYGINFDVGVSVQGEEAANEEVISKILSLENITEASYIKELSTMSPIKEEAVADVTSPYLVTINALDDHTLAQYANQVGASLEQLKNADQPSAIVIDTIKYKDVEKDKYVEAKAIQTKIGEELNLKYYNEQSGKNEALGAVEIVKLTEELPIGVMSLGQEDSLNIIMSQTTLEKIISAFSNHEEIRKSINATVFLKSDNPMKLQEAIEAVEDEGAGSTLSLYNVFVARQREAQMLLLMGIFSYAFILLITSIGAANIFNTISTGIALRKREFAMLKSVGMTPKSFNKMIHYESLFYGIKALIYGLPISFLAMWLIYRSLMKEFSFPFQISWVSVGTAVTTVFVIVGSAMIYASAKVKKENIIEALKQESI